MTLSTILLIVGSIAAVLTLIVGLIMKGHKSWIMTYAQNFCGVFFIFSGWVKAVDPLGTAYKMKDYFGEFQYTFEPTWFSFIAPVFPWLSNYSVSFSVFMIVLEIVLGLMLITGFKPKLTSWIFITIVGFFTVLTGFTFLTGYVPNGVNFFQFGNWGPYVESNMKVQDCGCFGDFIKLKPKVSFFKDIFLMMPALYFVFRHKDMHELFNRPVRFGIVVLSTVMMLFYCLSNYVWDIPHADFRPFQVNSDIRAKRIAELDALSNVDIIGWEFEKEGVDGSAVVMNPNYMEAVKDYPKADGWKVKDQVKTKPTLEKTKVSEYEIVDFDGNDLTEELLNDPAASIMIVSYQLKSNPVTAKRIVRDTSFVQDTIIVSVDSMNIAKRIGEIDEREEQFTKYEWDDDFIGAYKDVVAPFVNAAAAKGIKSYAVFGGADESAVKQLRDDAGMPNTKLYSADDILLKTIVRSNPGIVLWKDGKILYKSHYKQLETFENVESNYLK